MKRMKAVRPTDRRDGENRSRKEARPRVSTGASPTGSNLRAIQALREGTPGAPERPGIVQRVKGLKEGTPVRALHYGDTPVEGTIVKAGDDEYAIQISSYDGEKVTKELLGDLLLDSDVLVIPEQWVKPIEEIKKVPSEGFKITHFTPKERGMAPAEFVDPSKKRIDVTSHGLGTGIYGLAQPTELQIQQALEHDPTTEIHEVTMKNPLYLQDEEHGMELTRLSKGLQRLMIAMTMATEKPLGQGAPKGILVPPRLWPRFQGSDDLVARLTGVLKRVGRTDEDPAALIQATVQQFLLAYYGSGGEPIEQPINFLMKDLGYDGVYTTDPSYNRWSKGNVAYGYKPKSKKSEGPRIYL